MSTPLVEDCCTTDSVSQRHRPGALERPPTNALLGVAGQRGTTACGEADALDQAELDLWYAEWGIPLDRRASIDGLPNCPKCFPADEKGW